MIGHGLPVILVLMQFGSITRSTNEDWGLHPEWCLFFHGWLSPTTEWASSRRTPCVRPYCRGWLMSRTLDDVPCSILCCNSDYVRTVHYRVRFIWAFLFSFFFFFCGFLSSCYCVSSCWHSLIYMCLVRAFYCDCPRKSWRTDHWSPCQFVWQAETCSMGWLQLMIWSTLLCADGPSRLMSSCKAIHPVQLLQHCNCSWEEWSF